MTRPPTPLLYLAYPIKGVEPERLDEMVRARKVQLNLLYPYFAYLDCRDCPACEHCPPQSQGECPVAHHEYEDFVRGDLKEMLNCDGIILNFNWPDSVGCRNELQVALLCGLEVYLADDDGQLFDVRRRVML